MTNEPYLIWYDRGLSPRYELVEGNENAEQILRERSEQGYSAFLAQSLQDYVSDSSTVEIHGLMVANAMLQTATLMLATIWAALTALITVLIVPYATNPTELFLPPLLFAITALWGCRLTRKLVVRKMNKIKAYAEACPKPEPFDSLFHE